MAINIRNANFRVDVDSQGLVARFARIRHFFDENGDVPSYTNQATRDLARYNDRLADDRLEFPNLALSDSDRDNTWLNLDSGGQNLNNVLMFDSDGQSYFFNFRSVLKKYLNEFLERDIFERRKILENVIQSMDDDSEVNPRIVRRISDSFKNDSDAWNYFHEAFNQRMDSDSDVANTLSQIIINAVDNDSDQSRQLTRNLVRTLGSGDNAGDSDRDQFFTDIFYKYLNDDSDRWETLWDSLNAGYFDNSDSELVSRRATFLEELTSALDDDPDTKVSVGDDLATTLTHNQSSVAGFFEGVNEYLAQINLDSDIPFPAVDTAVTSMVNTVIDSEVAGPVIERGFQQLSSGGGLNASGPNSIGAIISSAAVTNIENVRMSRRVFFPGDVDKTFDDVTGQVVIGRTKDSEGVNPKHLRDSEFMDFPFPNPDEFVEPTRLSNIKVYVNGILQITNSGDFTTTTLVRGQVDPTFGLLTFDDYPEEARRITRELDDSDVSLTLSSPNVRPTVTLRFVTKRYVEDPAAPRYFGSNFASDSDSDGSGNRFSFYRALRVYFANIDSDFTDSEDYMFDSDLGRPTITDSDDNAFFLGTDDVVTIEYLTSRNQS